MKASTGGARRQVTVIVAAVGVWMQVWAPAAPLGSQGADTTVLSVVGTNDLHGGILPRDDRGGLALLGGYVSNLRAARARDGGAVILVDAGDMFQGTLESNLSEGAAVVAAYGALKYTAAAIGNHEFDFGPVGPAATPERPSDDPRGALKARASEAAFPFLAANLIDLVTGRPVAWPNVRPSVLVDEAGLKVGIVGVMTARALSATIAANTVGLSVAPLVPAIVTEATRLRGAGAAVVIVASHAGGRCERFDQPADLSSCESGSEIVQVAQALPPGLVDVIVAGHTHAAMAHQINGIAIAEQFSGGRAFGRVDVIVDRRANRVIARRSFPPRDLCARVTPGTLTCDPTGAATEARVGASYEGLPVTPDVAVKGMLDRVEESVSELKATSLGVVLETPIRRAGQPDSPLGNLFTDSFLASAPGADAALNNTVGGLRADLPQGLLTYGRLFEAFPFDNRLVQLRLTGGELRKAMTAQLEGRRGPVGIAGLRVRAQCANGSLKVTLLRPSGAEVGDAERLLVVTTDFLATGGDGILSPVVPTQGFTLEGDQPYGRDVVADALRRRGGALREAQLVDQDRPRWTFPGALPVTCRESTR